MFKKYPSLTNHYMSNDIERFKEMYQDDLVNTSWMVQEKIHGANMSFLFVPNKPVEIFSRNQKVDGDFYSASEIIDNTIEKMSSIQEWVNSTLAPVRLFGELFGANIQKGVDYGSTKNILFYDIQVDNIQKPLLFFELFFGMMNLSDLMVPKYEIFNTLDEALKYDINRDSELSDKQDNLIEGVVIKPYDIVLSDRNGSLFYIKYKNEKFKESQRIKKVRTETQYTEEVNEWREIFLSYIHEERCESVFSKEGRIESIREFNKFIPLIHQDTVMTFLKEEDFPSDTFTKSEQQYILNSSKTIVDILKGYL